MKFLDNIQRERILFAVLDWGLGHATRSSALIQQLLKKNNDIILASNGLAGYWLKNQFPRLEYVELPSYKVSYPKNVRFFKWHMAQQVPAWIKTFKHERYLTTRLKKKYAFRIIFSDNRPGIYSSETSSYYITHQLKVLSGITSGLTSFLHRKAFRVFNRILIPDFEGKDNLSGRLGHPEKISKKAFPPLQYIGPVSRFNKEEMNTNTSPTYRWLIIISGPEHQRTQFEKAILRNREFFGNRVALVRGTQEKIQAAYPSHWDIFDLAGTKTLASLIKDSEKIMSRSGYSSVMDWFVLKKSAVLVPTPGQYEQEYLAKYLNNKYLFASIQQKDLENLSSRNMHFPGFHFNLSTSNRINYE